MKKFSIIALAALLVVAFTVPASAIENVFGGYWRTRMVTQQNFSGADDDVEGAGQDWQGVDTRTRLYYTAVINDNLKFVNKFEFDHQWGAGPTFGGHNVGDLGADERVIEVKNSYADFNVGPVNAKVGIQGLVLHRGFLMDEDFSGAIVTYKGEGFAIPLVWIKPYEGGRGEDLNDEDFDIYGLHPSFTLGEGITLKPSITWATTSDGGGFGAFGMANDDEMDAWFLGLDADAKFGPVKVWFTGLYEDGDIEYAAAGTKDDDISAYLFDIGASYDFGMFDVHAEYFYASGDEDPNDNDIEAFGWASLSSHYWAEIMGLGIFDEQTSASSCADDVSNIWAANLGTKIKPMDKLTVAVDLWYAELAEDRVAVNAVNGNTEEVDTLGTEIDVVVTYQLVEGLNLDLVGAYLFADDGTYMDDEVAGVDQEDPYELGARLSLSF